LQEQSLRILVEGPVKIHSLLEAKREEAELAHEAQKHKVEVERKAQALGGSQETLQETLISTCTTRKLDWMTRRWQNFWKASA